MEGIKGYYSTMPWLTVDFEDPNREQLMEFYSVPTIPTLLILDKEGKAKIKDGRGEINSRGFDALKAW